MGEVVVGSVRGSFGVKGWIKIHSYTDRPESILDYAPWTLELSGSSRQYALLDGRLHGDAVIALLDGVATPEDAQALRGARIVVDRTCFPEASPGEFYRIDLLGCEVRNLAGKALGTVREVMETGANDVLVLRGERERLVPFVQGAVVKSVDLPQREILVDWDEEF